MNRISDRLRQSRANAGFANAKDAAESLGVGYSTYASHENGGRGVPRDAAIHYAKRFNVSLQWLLTGKGEPEPKPTQQNMTVAELPIIGRVSAGGWMDAEEFDQSDSPPEMVPALSLYPPEYQFAVVVDGNSVNKIANSGEVLICLDAIKSGIPPKDNDLVIVERKRFGGEMFQFTAKRLRNGISGLELWPESTDPNHQTPIPYKENDGDEVSIRGTVLFVLRKI